VRLLIAIILIVYFIGVGVELAPTFQTGWSTLPASELSANVLHALPDALAWPAKVYRSFTSRGVASA
jgi:hypothetical protein